MSRRVVLRGIATCVTLLACIVSAAGIVSRARAQTTYGDDLAFLARHTRVLELSNGKGARIAICPEYQGRIMTSTCGGTDSASFGWINRAFIEAGEPDPHFNNFGGEDRLWLAPEGGQFSLWFAQGKSQSLEHWLTPPALNDGPFQVTSEASDPFYRLSREMQFTNASGTEFRLVVDRTVRLLDTTAVAQSLGPETTGSLAKAANVRWVGFESHNEITNRGEHIDKAGGLVSAWVLGQFPGGDETVIIVPYRAGSVEDLGPPVHSDYFAAVPANRLRVTDAAILFRGDGQFRSKIGVSPRRVMAVAGAIDFAAPSLTLVHFDLPAQPAEAMYLENRWILPQQKPFAGDAMNSYNDGPPEPGAASLGGFFELESLSPAQELARGASLSHAHRTFHFQGDLSQLAPLAKAALGVDLAAVRDAIQD